MKALTKLKDDARKHEQKEEWDKAVQLYLEVIRTAEEGEGDSELPLYNRVGDLYVRMSRPSDAVAYYEKAADRYAEAGLFNNAIALCNKALRYLPNRTELLRKLGQFSASQGFITEARRWYLEYAERKLKEGALDDAFQALDDFASVHEDADVREMLGRQLLAHNRREHALQELKKAYELRVAAGQSDASVRLMDEILTIDPGAFTPGGQPSAQVPEPPAELPLETQAFEAPQIESWAAPAPPEAPVEPMDLGIQTTADAFGAELPSDPGLIDLDDLRLPGLEPPAEPTPGSTLADTALDQPAESEAAAFDFDAALADFNVEITGAPGDIDDALLAPIDLDSIDLGGGTIDLGSGADTHAAASENVDLGGDSHTDDSDSMAAGDANLDVDSGSFAIGGLDNLDTGLDGIVAALDPVDAVEENDAGFEDIDAGLDSLDDALDGNPDVGLVDLSATGLEQATSHIDDALIEPLPLIDTGVQEEDEPFELPLLEPLDSGTTGGFDAAAFETAFEADEIEPLPLLGEEEEEEEPAAEETFEPAAVEPFEPAPEIAFDGPAVETGENEPGFEVETPVPDIGSAFDEAQDVVSETPVVEPAPENAGLDTPVAESAPESARFDTPVFELDEVSPGDSTLPSPDVRGEDNQPAAFDYEPVDFDYEPAEEVTEADAPASIEFEPAAESLEYEFEEGGEEDLEPDWTETFAAAREFAQRGETAAAIEELVILHESLDASGMHREALQVIEELVRLEPGSVSHLQQRVEYATRVGDTASLVRAYLDLADRLARSGSAVKANAIYQRVLDIEPTNAIARNAVYTPPTPVQTNSEGYVDLFSLLTEEEETGTRFVVEEKPPTGDEERDFADMLSQFKQKLADHVPFDDSSSHYDLGLAFKEMGLVDDAIAEFQIALKGGQDRLKIYEELGQCFLLKQQYNIAITILNRALNMGADDGDLVGVYYHIARSYEEMGQRVEAKTAYERVVGVDISFKDAAERLARL